MLFPKNVRHMLSEEHGKFMARYERMLDKQKEIMYKRGEDRDNESPIYFRRSPEMNLGVAQSKIHRIEALLTKLNVHSPAVLLLKKLIEECLDAANYLLFIAVLCSIVLSEEEQEAERPHPNPQDIRDWLGVGRSYQQVQDQFGASEEIEEIYQQWLDEGAPPKIEEETRPIIVTTLKPEPEGLDGIRQIAQDDPRLSYDVFSSTESLP